MRRGKCDKARHISLGIGDMIEIRSGRHKGRKGHIRGFALDRFTGLGPRGLQPMGIAGAKVLKLLVRLPKKDDPLGPSSAYGEDSEIDLDTEVCKLEGF